MSLRLVLSYHYLTRVNCPPPERASILLRSISMEVAVLDCVEACDSIAVASGVGSSGLEKRSEVANKVDVAAVIIGLEN